MALIRRLDHIIVAVADRQQWIPLIERTLQLSPGRMLEGSGNGAGAFGNAELAIGCAGSASACTSKGRAAGRHRSRRAHGAARGARQRRPTRPTSPSTGPSAPDRTPSAGRVAGTEWPGAGTLLRP